MLSAGQRTCVIIYSNIQMIVILLCYSSPSLNALEKLVLLL